MASTGISRSVSVCLLIATWSRVAALTNIDQLRAQTLEAGEQEQVTAATGTDEAGEHDQSTVATASAGAKEQEQSKVATATACRQVIQASYDGGTVINQDTLHNAFVYQEPYRTLSPDDWVSLRVPFDGGYPEKFTQNQSVRIASMSRIYQFMPSFFDTHFPDTTWWLQSGTLLGAARTGVPMPWDCDGDVGVVSSFNSAATIDAMRAAFGEPIATHSDNCTRFGKPGGECLAWHVGEDILFSTFPLPATFAWFARFIDLRTGFNVEILKEFLTKVPTKVTKARLAGAWLPVPAEPVSMVEELTKEYGNTDFPLSMMSSEMFECTCAGDHFTELEVLPDAFSMTASRPCDAAKDMPWDLVEGSVEETCCRKVAEQKVPLMEDEHWDRVRAEEAANGTSQGDGMPLKIALKFRRTSDDPLAF